MNYNTELADRVREYLAGIIKIEVVEKRMFGGLAFMINGKMCINVSGENLMCRFNPELTLELSERKGYMPMIMKGKEIKGYCYIEPTGFKEKENFEFWIDLCLQFNEIAQASR